MPAAPRPEARVAALRAMTLRYGPAMLLANAAGAAVVFCFLTFLLPVAPHQVDSAGAQRVLNGVLFVGYLPLALVVGTVWGTRLSRPVLDWLDSTDPSRPAVAEAGLRLPLRQLRVNATMWVGASLLFSAFNVPYSPAVAGNVGSTILLGGFTTCALGYLLAERLLRPAVTVLLAGVDAPPTRVLGVRARLLLAWGLGTGVPVLGIGLGLLPLGDTPPLTTAGELTLVGITLLVGALSIAGAAGAVSDPVESVARALGEVGEGDLQVTVPVYDASEVGQLQSGFNSMVGGLRERERLRDLFGRQVGPGVARLALEQGVQLGGERREVAVLFVDVIGSTALAESLGPAEVVTRLNAFFSVVVDAVTGCGGWVNKFEGDAALCIFGAPTRLDDCRTSALQAGRELVVALRPLPLDAAVGVSAGAVVAGHVGAESRFEYTVVGDPVNAAARLAELAKAEPSRLLADDTAVRRASAAEQSCWTPGEQVVLRGRSSSTQVWLPRAPGADPAAAS